MAWKVPMVRPNCTRSWAYSTAESTQAAMPPTASAAPRVRARARARVAAPPRTLSGLEVEPVARHGDGATGRIEVRVRRSRARPERAGLDDDDVIAHPQHEEVGRRPAQDRPGVAVQRACRTRVRSSRTQAERGGRGAVGQPGQQTLALLVGAALVDDGRGQHRGQEGPGRHLATELVEHHHQFEQSGARPP